jgi:V8-like Glu-specific endopeptidase
MRRSIMKARRWLIAVWVLSLLAGTHLAFAEEPSVTANQVPGNAEMMRPEYQDALISEESAGINSGKLPKDFDTYQPVPMPESPGPKVGPGFVNEIITYDAATGKEIRTPVAPYVPSEPSQHTLPYRGIAEALGVDETVVQQAIKNFTDLQLISDPEPHPWRVNCKLFFTQPSGSWVASGVLVDQSHVLTAGHCVHGGPGDGWNTSTTVIPAYHNGVQPYGNTGFTQLHTYTGWASSGDFDYDMGMIDLDRPVGALTGWHGYGYNNDNSYFTNNTFHNPGYPAESPYNGLNMYYWYGTFDHAYTYQLCIDRYAYGGQSGSGAYYWDGGSGRWVYAVMSNHSGTPSSGTGCLVRVTSQRFTDIGTWISDDTPTSLDLTPIWVKCTPSSIDAGSALSTMNFRLVNTSSAGATVTPYFGVYLSTNDYISTSDRRISTQFLTWTFTAKSSVNINCAPSTIPSDVTPGNYWIGVILDDSDANNGNNASQGQDAYPITVTCPSVSAPSQPSTSNPSPCANESYTICWGSVGGATGYQLYENGSLVYDGPSICRSRSHASGSYSYYARAKNDCGSISGSSPTGGATTIQSCPWQSDFDQDGYVTPLDLAAMIDILFAGQPDVQDPNCPIPRADFDCDGYTTPLDLAGLIDYLFTSGPGPCDPCSP